VLSLREFTIGVAASGAETLAAVISLFDSRLECDPLPLGDDNSYGFGHIAGHNVVVLALPFGDNRFSAIGAVQRMLASFPNVFDVALVGLAGAIPTATRDIRLGDVVVSAGSGISVTDSAETSFHLAPPGKRWLSAVQSLQARELRERSSMQDYLAELAAKSESFSRPKLFDRLFESKSIHQSGADDCSACSGVIERHRRSDSAIHIGLIATGSVALRDSSFREVLGSQGALCYDVAAGVASIEMSYIAIRGISDYCDSHPNDGWRGYASAAAASYLKCLLREISPVQSIPVPTGPLDFASNYREEGHFLGQGSFSTVRRCEWLCVSLLLSHFAGL
jgi:nucleoside phosphorylase